MPQPTIEDLQEDIQEVRELLMRRLETIPSDALWTLREARVRLSHGLNAKALSEEELADWLDDRRTMGRRALENLRKDERCPIRAIKVSGRHKRIPEALIQRHLDQQREESRPESLNQI